MDEGAGGGEGAVGGGAPGDVSGSDGGDGNSGGVNVSPIPLIPRRRLREILEHAQGECIMCSVFIVCVKVVAAVVFAGGHVVP